MKRFIEGEDRRQGVCFPSAWTTTSSEDNPGPSRSTYSSRSWTWWRLGFEGAEPAGDRPPGVSPGDAAQDLHLRLPQPHPVQPPAGAGGAAQRRADVADRPAGARLQDHRRLPAGQRRGDPEGLPRVRRAVPASWGCSRRRGGDRRQQVQGGQQPRQELHRRTSCRRGWQQLEESIERYLDDARPGGPRSRVRCRPSACRI